MDQSNILCSLAQYYKIFFHLVSIFEKLDSKYKSFLTEELKILNNTLIRYVHLFTLNYLLQYAKRLVT